MLDRGSRLLRRSYWKSCGTAAKGQKLQQNIGTSWWRWMYCKCRSTRDSHKQKNHQVKHITTQPTNQYSKDCRSQSCHTQVHEFSVVSTRASWGTCEILRHLDQDTQTRTPLSCHAQSQIEEIKTTTCKEGRGTWLQEGIFPAHPNHI
jgi:hypothetical protein